MDKHFVSSSAVEVDTYSEWTYIEGSEIDHSEDLPKPASTDKPAPSEVEGDFCLLDPPHPNEGSGEVTPNANNQPSLLGRLWNSVPSFGAQLISGSDKPSLLPLDEDTQQDMAANDQEEQKSKPGRGIFSRIKTAWKSEDEKVSVTPKHACGSRYNLVATLS